MGDGVSPHTRVAVNRRLGVAMLSRPGATGCAVGICRRRRVDACRWVCSSLTSGKPWVKITADELIAIGTIPAAAVALAAFGLAIAERRSSAAESRLQRYFYLHEFLARKQLATARYVVRSELAYKPCRGGPRTT